MDPEAIAQHITDLFAAVEIFTASDGIAAGDRFFYYNPQPPLDMQRQFPFATIVTKDYGEFDCASDLNRPGVFRLNIGVSQQTFRTLFPPRPGARDAAGSVDPDPAGDASASAEHDYDFTALDQLLPHPVYAPQSWVCVLNPSAETFDRLQPLLKEAHERAVKRHGSGTRDTDAS